MPPTMTDTTSGQSARSTPMTPTWKFRSNERTVSSDGARLGSYSRATRKAQMKPGTPTVMNATRQP